MSSIFSSFWPKKWPTKKQWKKLPKNLDKREKSLLLSLILITFFSFVSLSYAFYTENTKEIPGEGGVFYEGVLKNNEDFYINPLYARQGSAGRDIAEILYVSLMEHNDQGKLSPGIAKEYTTEDGKTFDVFLQEDVYWSDGEEVTASDVEFTVNTILDRNFESPLKQEWSGVSVEKISSHHVRFSLERPSSIFTKNLTLKVLPEHVFSDHSPEELQNYEYSANSVSSGPYKFKEIRRSPEGDPEFISLERNTLYLGERPFINDIVFLFFESEESLYRAKNQGTIDGYAVPDNFKSFPFEEIRGTNYYEFYLPRYFSAIFNIREESIIQDKETRQALNYAIDKKALLEKTLEGKGEVINSPLFAEFYNLKLPEQKYPYNPEKAREIIESKGFQDGKKEIENPFSFTKDLKEGSQGEEVRKLQECFLYLREEDDNLYPHGEVAGYFNEEVKEAVNYFQEKHSETILEPQGFSSGTGMVASGTQKKLNEVCKDLFAEDIIFFLSITTLKDPLLLETAKEIKRQWEKLDIETEIKRKSFAEMQETIQNRDFEILLFGTMLPRVVNPLPLWHSSKVESPDLNLAGYKDQEVDALLEDLEKTINKKKREEVFVELQEKLTKDAPGVFLYSPYFIYSVSERIKGIEEKTLTSSSERFKNISSWYINTRRVLDR